MYANPYIHAIPTNKILISMLHNIHFSFPKLKLKKTKKLK
jgi:hypothetical protein